MNARQTSWGPAPDADAIEALARAALARLPEAFRRPLLDEWAETGVALEALVSHVLIHEVGHHFGLSDADMHALEDGAP